MLSETDLKFICQRDLRINFFFNMRLTRYNAIGFRYTKPLNNF